jgi:hypothetical protein
VASAHISGFIPGATIKFDCVLVEYDIFIPAHRIFSNDIKTPPRFILTTAASELKLISNLLQGFVCVRNPFALGGERFLFSNGIKAAAISAAPAKVLLLLVLVQEKFTRLRH